MENVVIIGGGPAGLSAALYTARAGLSPLVFGGSPPGGQLTLTSEIENYLGFESILGPELIEKFKNHAKKFGARVVDENVVKVDFSKKPFEIYINESFDAAFLDRLTLKGPRRLSKNGYLQLLSKSVIIATGAKALWLGLESEKRLRGKGVSACATCDGFFFKNKKVAIVGGGDKAFEEALTLTKFAEKVYIINRRDQCKASKIMQDRVNTNKKIKIILNETVEDIIGQQKVEAVKLKNQTLAVDGVFVAIGHRPDTELFLNQVKLDKKGYILTNHYMSSIPGIFAAGDCVDHLYQQASYAMGMGVGAALEAERWLAGQNNTTS
jgi:thioredoxin reductase (NADPH)